MSVSKESLAEINPYRTFKLHIAIDFGTDGVGLAYAYNNEVFVHSKWSSKKYGDQIKPKSLILLDHNGKTMAFGLDAKFSYMALPSQKNDWNLFERFKMSLYEPQHHIDKESENGTDDDEEKKVEIMDMLTATNGNKVAAEKVFIAAFKHIQCEAMKFLKKKKIKKINNNETQWIITVPSIWSDCAKSKMKEWAMKAGLINNNIPNHCKIVYEPDCAALAILYYIKTHKFLYDQINDDGDNSSHFNIGDKYILVDAGGGTVDVICHEILDSFGVKEINYPSGGKWGSCYIDDQYIKLLQSIFSTRWINEFKKQSPSTYVELINYFQVSKAKFYENHNNNKEKQEKQKENESVAIYQSVVYGNKTLMLQQQNNNIIINKNGKNNKNNKNNDGDEGEYHNVRLPSDFLSFIEEKLDALNNATSEEKEIEHIIRDYCSGKNMIKLNGEQLEISYIVWKLMFDHAINPTIDHIKKLLNESMMRNNCKYLCLVGGLSCSKYYQYRMNTEFGIKSKYKLNIVVPQRPILSVVEGAAYFGIRSNYIQSRILRYTYGKAANVKLTTAQKKNISSEYIEKNKYYNEHRGKYKVRNIFDIFVTKGDEIKFGQVIKGKQHRHNSQSTHTTVRILCSDMESPKIKSDGKEIARLRVDFDEENDKEQVEIEFCFWDTVIKVFAYSIATPHIKKELQLDYNIIDKNYHYSLDQHTD